VGKGAKLDREAEVGIALEGEELLDVAGTFFSAYAILLGQTQECSRQVKRHGTGGRINPNDPQAPSLGLEVDMHPRHGLVFGWQPLK